MTRQHPGLVTTKIGRNSENLFLQIRCINKFIRPLTRSLFLITLCVSKGKQDSKESSKPKR
jgi:hypothetical protein